MGYADTTSGHITTAQSGEVAIIRTEMILNQLINVIQTTVTQKEQYRGLDETTAKTLASTGTGGLISQNLGGIKVTVSSGTATVYFIVYGCRGTIATASASRDSDSHLWNVDYELKTLTCTASGGTVEDI